MPQVFLCVFLLSLLLLSLVFARPLMLECWELLSPESSLHAWLKSKLTANVGHCMTVNKHHSYVKTRTVNRLCYAAVWKQRVLRTITKLYPTLSSPSFCTSTQPYLGLHWSLLLFQLQTVRHEMCSMRTKYPRQRLGETRAKQRVPSRVFRVRRVQTTTFHRRGVCAKGRTRSL